MSPHQPGGNRAAAAGEEQGHPGREGTGDTLDGRGQRRQGAPRTGGDRGDRGHPGREGTPRMGGDTMDGRGHHGQEGTEQEQHRPQ